MDINQARKYRAATLYGVYRSLDDYQPSACCIASELQHSDLNLNVLQTVIGDSFE
jgi:hypothetical protein